MTAKKVRRFLLKLMLVVALPAVLLVVLVESGIAGRTLLRLAGSTLDVELKAERVRIGWGGTVRLKQLSAVLADEEVPFFSAAGVTVTLNSLPKLVASLDPNVTCVRLVGPILTLRSDDAGRLNIAPLLSAFGASSDHPRRTGPPVIPDFIIVNGRINYERDGKDPVTLSRINVESVTTDDNKIKFTLALSGHNTLEGTVDPETFDHTLSLCLTEAAALANLTNEKIPQTLSFRADWKGQVVSGRPWSLGGDLTVRELTLDNMQLDGKAAIAFDATTLSAEIKRVDLTLPEHDTLPGGISIAGGSLVYAYADNRVAVKRLTVALLDGNAVIDGQLRPGQWFESRGTVEFSDLRPPLISSQAIEDVLLSGSVNIEPAADSRAIEPLAISLKLQLDGEAFKTAGLQEINAGAYWGASRLITETITIPVFGGMVQPWISLTRRDGEWFTHVISDFKDIELERVLKTFTDEADSVPGKLSGTLRCRTSGSLKTLSGNTEIRLTESDLMHTKIVGDVYSALNLAFGELDAKGEGKMVLSAQGEKIEIMSFEYFNRGAEVRGAGEIAAITMGKLSPVSGFATGSMRPLPQTRLPGTKELDRLITGLQVGLVTVKISGTLGDASTRVVPLPEVQNALRGLLWQQLRE
jgi:hypothetical protein